MDRIHLLAKEFGSNFLASEINSLATQSILSSQLSPHKLHVILVKEKLTVKMKEKNQEVNTKERASHPSRLDGRPLEEGGNGGSTVGDVRPRRG
jgi:hypothetical protein